MPSSWRVAAITPRCTACSSTISAADVRDATRREAVWYGHQPVPLAWRLLETLFAQVSALRRWSYRRWLKPRRLPVPVIVVGNVSVGGTGKTPVTIGLIEGLCARGLRPGVISRGYGGAVESVQRVDAGSTPALVGDEPFLIHQRTGVPVVVGRDRVAAGEYLLRTDDVDVVIADDGLQHYRLARDIEICVVDGVRRFGNGRLLPAGPLREPASRASECDFVICNGAAPRGDEIALHLVPSEAVSLREPVRRQPLAAFAGVTVHAVAGIGNPARFFDMLRAQGMAVIAHPFPDHHAFTAADVVFEPGMPVLMTDKDAVKVRPFATDDHWTIPVLSQLPDAFLDALAARVRNAAHR
ncbi:tetraacyldisaccharide 4'-kinase [Tahibacter amnicola]|uniref:Tetraacyldisaccharide 4'-kinase n=1 Tax=Tahibacter amnicola TaxID=2976241 RepID=A0ABY6BDQ2_9GAMM|nr:tetraacyldisaccharide 4'-kinase [Tahibacter amnicola]UXI66746.1 tetraacyldisaccharide 4'-kinase [Tahibacter amnicola]